MTVIIKHYIIIIGTMKNNYLYNVMLKSKKKIIKILMKRNQLKTLTTKLKEIK